MRGVKKLRDIFETSSSFGEDLLSFHGVVSTLHCPNCDITRIQCPHLGKDRGLVCTNLKIRELFLGRILKLPCLELSPEKNGSSRVSRIASIAGQTCSSSEPLYQAQAADEP